MEQIETANAPYPAQSIKHYNKIVEFYHLKFNCPFLFNFTPHLSQYYGSVFYCNVIVM